MTWLAKLKRYGLGSAESVLSHHSTKEEAQAVVDDWNTDYQTDTAYVEPYDKAKLDWPDISDAT